MAEDNKWALDKELDLDMSLDDIEDLPGFAVFPTGSYVVVLHEGINLKLIGEEGKEQKPIFEVPMTLAEIMECPADSLDAETDDGAPEAPPKIGDIETLAFMADNKVGADAFKKFLKPIAARLGTSKLGDLTHDERPGAKVPGGNQTKGLKILLVQKRTYNDKKDRHYAKAKRVAVL